MFCQPIGNKHTNLDAAQKPPDRPPTGSFGLGKKENPLGKRLFSVGKKEISVGKKLFSQLKTGRFQRKKRGKPAKINILAGKSKKWAFLAISHAGES